MRRGAGTGRATIGVLVCAIVIPLALSGCSAERPTAGSPDPALRGQWVLTAAHDDYGNVDLLGQDITLTVSEKPVSTGRGSCSNYTATIYGSLRDLWVTTNYTRSYSCATADQSVLQLQYLADLSAVQRSAITPNGLELTGRNVDLQYSRANALSRTQLMSKTWQLQTNATLNLHGPFTMSHETGGYIRFETKSTLYGVTKCVSFTANYRQIADELVASHVLAIDNIGCDQSDDQAAKDFSRMFDGGFTFALGSNSLVLISPRAGLQLGFNELGTP
jgi:heat shock protein HslJ